MADDFGMGYALGQDSTGGGRDGMFGGDAWWAIILFAMIFGWGRGGLGGFGGGNDGGVTRGDLCDGFNFNNLENAVRGVQQGICDSTYALNNSIMSGFHGVDNAICTLGYQTQSGFNTLGHQISDCCCTTQRAIDGVNYNIANCCCDLKQTMNTNTRDIIDAQNCGTRQILDFLTNEKIDSLRAENQALKFQASQAAQNSFIIANQEAQTAELIRRINPAPVPAYSVPAPYPYCNTGWGWNREGCNCGC